jgi:hypothetical protein
MLYAIATILGRFLDFFSCFCDVKRKKRESAKKYSFSKIFFTTWPKFTTKQMTAWDSVNKASQTRWPCL